MSEVFESIKRGLEQALEHANGHEEWATIHKPKSLDVKKLRETLEMNENGFAHALNISVNTHYDIGNKENVNQRALL
ncbi:DNA-binding protein [Beggiatoa sp. PS]|nr:DNA-binding protein [Beggiatoa sp. PS]